MPTYGYQCTECQHEFSVFQAMKDNPIETCPQCSGKVKRLLYPVGVVFKGSGWYINDSRKPDKSESAGAEKAEGEKSGTETKSDTGSDSKSGSPDSKPADKPAAPAASGAAAGGSAADK